MTSVMGCMLTSFLYHVTVGRGDPLAEQLTSRVSRIPGTGMEADGVVENSGSTGNLKRKCLKKLFAHYKSIYFIRSIYTHYKSS